MKLVFRESDGDFIVRITRDELRILKHGIEETLKGLDTWDFSIRVGANREQAERLLYELNALLNAQQ